MLFYLALLFAVVMSVCETETGAYTDCVTQAAMDQGATTCDTQFDAMVSCTCDLACTSECNTYYTCTADNPLTQLTACADQSTAYTDCIGAGDLTPVGAGPCYDGSFNTIDGCTCDDSCALCGYSDSPTGADDCITCADFTAVTPEYPDGTGTCGGSAGGDDDDGSDEMCVEEVAAYTQCMIEGNCTNESDLVIVCLMAEEGVSTECTTQYTALFDCAMDNELAAGTCTNEEELEDAAEECYMMNSGDDCMVCMATNEDSCPDESDVTAYCTCLCSACFDDCPAVMMAACADGSQAECIEFCEGDMAAGDGVDFDMCGCDAGVVPDACGVCGGTDTTTCPTGAGTGDGADGDGAMGLLLSVVFFLQAFLW